MGPRQSQTRGSLQGPTAGVVKPRHKLFQIDGSHFSPSRPDMPMTRGWFVDTIADTGTTRVRPVLSCRYSRCYFEALSRKKGTSMVDFPEGFDLAALLEPIPGEVPQGVDIREDFSSQSPYNRLRDARSEARDNEKMENNGDPNAGDPAPMWRTVREVGLKTLKETAKDLEVAAWVTE